VNGQRISVSGDGYSVISSGSGVVVIGGNGSSQFVRRGSELGLSIRTDGDVGLMPDGRGAHEISAGGYLDVELERDGISRRVRYEGTPDGVERGFWRGGERQAWDAAADEFVLEVMPSVFRSTILSANERMDWLLETGGDDALLDEIELMNVDAVQAHYTLLYAERGPIGAQHLERLLALASQGIAADSELHNVLAALYESQDIDDEGLVALLRAADSIASDAVLATLLGSLAAAAADNAASVPVYLDRAATIASDNEQSAALEALLANERLDDSFVRRALELAETSISSDGVLASLLRDVAARVARSDALAESYVRAAGTISSDSYMHGALLALGERSELGARGFRALLDAALSISSDSYCASLLTSLAPRLPRDAATVAAYRRVVDTISSGAYRSRALDALG
jgi:hypothetical protein